MKNIYLLILFLILYSHVSAQKIDAIAQKSIDEAASLLDAIPDLKLSDQVKVAGLGECAYVAREPKKFNNALAAYLISKKGFRNIVLNTDDWLLRPINSYLKNAMPTDTAVLDSLIKMNFFGDRLFRNQELRSLFTWVKNYNLVHRDDPVNIYGVVTGKIPVSYFLANYIFAIDEASGKKLSVKWADNGTPDSVAYADIKTWANASKNKSLTPVQQTLLDQGLNDLPKEEYSIIFRSQDQKFPQQLFKDRAAYAARQIIKRTVKKTIFLALSTSVMKADLASNFVADQLPVPTIGKCLDLELKEGYFALVTGFAGTARLPIVNAATGETIFENISAPEQEKVLYQKNDLLERKKHTDLLKGYKPLSYNPFKTIVTEALVPKDSYAIDALALFSTLSATDLNY